MAHARFAITDGGCVLSPVTDGGALCLGEQHCEGALDSSDPAGGLPEARTGTGRAAAVADVSRACGVPGRSRGGRGGVAGGGPGSRAAGYQRYQFARHLAEFHAHAARAQQAGVRVRLRVLAGSSLTEVVALCRARVRTSKLQLRSTLSRVVDRHKPVLIPLQIRRLSDLYLLGDSQGRQAGEAARARKGPHGPVGARRLVRGRSNLVGSAVAVGERKTAWNRGKSFRLVVIPPRAVPDTAGGCSPAAAASLLANISAPSDSAAATTNAATHCESKMHT